MARPEADLKLWETWRLGGQDSGEAYEELVSFYLPLVRGIVAKQRRTLPTYVDGDDLFSFGSLGLLKAMQRFDPEKGDFSKYASAVVWGAIVDGLRANDYAPRMLRKQQRTINAIEEVLRSEGNIHFTNQEVADRMGVELETLNEIKAKLIVVDVAPTDPVVLHQEYEAVEDGARLICGEFVDWLSRFSKTHRKIIALKYWKGMRSNTRIAKTLKIDKDVVDRYLTEVLEDIIPYMRELL